MSIGQNIRDARKKAHLRQADLSTRTGLSTMTIRRYESGEREPKPSDIANIAKALGVKISDILPDQPESTTDAAMTTILDMLKRHREIEARFEATGTNASEMVQSYAHVADTANELGISADTLNSILKDLILKERASDPKWQDLNLRVERDRQAGRLDHLPPVKPEE